MNTLDAIRSRKSVRQFTGEPITDGELKTILMAANAAPIGMAKYDEMHLTVISDKGLLDRIGKTAEEMFKAPGMDPLHGAPTLVLVSTKEPGPAGANVAYSNAATIVENMSLAATELGVGMFHVWGAVAALSANAELVKELKLPEGFIPCCAAALGKTDYTYTPREISEDRIAVNYIG